ncbi:DUF6587 family protein [Hydrocarboniphaga sp.]|uniref:DUF6587 family protein n=1 Tax=Hydrocarboniphaga sp. TaxID=2033016 RepID=UPI003D0B6077
MTISVFVQYLIIGACVLLAGFYMLGRYAPKLLAVPRAWLAKQLAQRGHARAAALMQPAGKSGGGCHSGGDDACGSCGSCGTASSDRKSNEQPLIFHRKH